MDEIVPSGQNIDVYVDRMLYSKITRFLTRNGPDAGGQLPASSRPRAAVQLSAVPWDRVYGNLDAERERRPNP